MAEKKTSKPSGIIEEISASKKYKSKKARLAHAIFVVVMLAIMFGVIAGITYRITSKVGLYMDEKSAEESKSHVNISGPAEENPNPVPNSIMNVSELADKIRPAIVTVQLRIEKKDSIFDESVVTYKNNAGIIVAKDEHNYYVLTDGSNLTKSSQFTVSIGEKALAGRFEGVSKAFGLAVVTVNFDSLSKENKEKVKTLTFSKEPPKLGETVMAIGSPNGQINSIDAGIITGTGNYKYFSDMSYELMTSNMRVYSKGSGLVVNEKGNICGLIVKDKINPDVFTFVNLTSEIDLIEMFVNSIKIPYAGAICEKLSSSDISEGNITEGVYVSSVIVNSPAEKAGLRGGDILVKLDDSPVASPQDYKKILLQYRSGSSIEYKIVRDGEEKSFTVTLN